MHIGIIFSCIEDSQWGLYNTQSISDWLPNTQLVKNTVKKLNDLLENNENATFNMNVIIPPAYVGSAH